MARHRGAWGVLALLLVGCVEGRHRTDLVPAHGGGGFLSAGRSESLSVAPASKEAATRVGQLGEKVFHANRQTGLRPHVTVIGAPTEELFHRGRTDIVLTEGLVQKCASDGQVAALLCRELARMVVEREAMRGPAHRDIEVPTPQEVRVGNDHAGLMGTPDATRLMELGKYEQEQKRRREMILPAPDVLARDYLRRAGYTGRELDEVAPLLQTAEEHATFERQMTGQGLPTVRQ